MLLDNTVGGAVSCEVVAWKGWERNLRVTNDEVELLITLDVGPRVLSYRPVEGENIFHVVPEHQGSVGEETWRSRGGHRFWLAPESLELSYYPDNETVGHRVDATTGEVILETLQATPYPVAKTLGVTLEASGSRVTVRHCAENRHDQPIHIATWGLSVMRPGGLALIPQPPHGQHPRDLLPDRHVVLWPYTDLTDGRWRLGRNYWTLRQRADGVPTKMGCAHRQGWVAYLHERTLFVKFITYREGASYPDNGCNFETFSNAKMLEVESLGPLRTLAPGETATHREVWHLLSLDEVPDCRDDAPIDAWLLPRIDALAASSEPSLCD